MGFLVLAESLGHVGAAVVALLVCSVVNNAANRRLTFALTGRTRRLRHFARGLGVALLPLAAILVTLSLLAFVGTRSVVVALAALTVVNVAVGLGRFALLRRWVFESRP